MQKMRYFSLLQHMWKHWFPTSTWFLFLLRSDLVCPCSWQWRELLTSQQLANDTYKVTPETYTS